MIDLVMMLWENCEELQNFGLERPLNVQSLMSYCRIVEDNAEVSEDGGGLACGVLERNLRVPYRLFWGHLIILNGSSQLGRKSQLY